METVSNNGKHAMKKTCLTLFAAVLFLLYAGKFAQAEEYLGLLAGNNAKVADATVSLTRTQLLCFTPPCSQTAAGNVQFNRGHNAGIRYGFWLESFGMAAEYSTSGFVNSYTPGTSPAITSVEVNYDALTLFLMLRTPMLQSDYLPDSYLYAGLGMASVYGRYSVVTQKLGSMSGQNTVDAPIFMIGGTMRFSRVMLFAEWRRVELNFNYSFLGDSLSIPVNSSEALFGVAYWF